MFALYKTPSIQMSEKFATLKFESCDFFLRFFYLTGSPITHESNKILLSVATRVKAQKQCDTIFWFLGPNTKAPRLSCHLVSLKLIHYYSLLFILKYPSSSNVMYPDNSTSTSTVIIFDWDDTICPSTFVDQHKINCFSDLPLHVSLAKRSKK